MDLTNQAGHRLISSGLLFPARPLAGASCRMPRLVLGPLGSPSFVFRHGKPVVSLDVSAKQVRWGEAGEMMAVQVQAMCLWSEPDMVVCNKECGISLPILSGFEKEDRRYNRLEKRLLTQQRTPTNINSENFDFQPVFGLQHTCSAISVPPWLQKGFLLARGNILCIELIYLSLQHLY